MICWHILAFDLLLSQATRLGYRHAMYIHQHTFVGTLMYRACLCPNLVSVHFCNPYITLNIFAIIEFEGAGGGRWVCWYSYWF